MRQIDLSQLKELECKTDILLVDVREEEEHAAYNIGGLHIPLSEIINRSVSIPKDIPVIFYCRKGIRSQIAIQRLEEKYAYTNLINLRGGIGDNRK